jgi:nitrogen regulatory protein P-II 2
MQMYLMKRVVIIGDCDVQYRLLKEIEGLGATGYTYYTVRGEGARGIRPRHGESGNMKIEVIATPEVAVRIMKYLAEHYFNRYPMIAFLDEVEVLEGQKFGAESPQAL